VRPEDMELVHHMVHLFTPHLSTVLTVLTKYPQLAWIAGYIQDGLPVHRLSAIQVLTWPAIN